MTLPGGGGPAQQLTGQGLRAVPPRRLSYLLRSGPCDPPTVLTWQLRTTAGGTTLRLQIDEIEGSSDDDAEDTWLPVLAALRTVLEEFSGLDLRDPGNPAAPERLKRSDRLVMGGREGGEPQRENRRS
jgi:hypothetical protein